VQVIAMDTTTQTVIVIVGAFLVRAFWTWANKKD
jgi:hypothetical protein